MRDLNITRLIPFATGVVSLVAVGCSSKEESVARDYCEYMQECDSKEFSEDFDSVAECTETYEEYIDDYVDKIEEVSNQACGDAVLEVLRCGNDFLSCGDELGEGDFEGCDSEVEDYQDECDGALDEIEDDNYLDYGDYGDYGDYDDYDDYD